MDSAVVLEMDSMSVTAEEKDDEAESHREQDRRPYQNLEDSGVDLARDYSLAMIQHRFADVSLEDCRPASCHFSPVIIDEEAVSDDDTCTVISDSDEVGDIDRVMGFSLPVAVGINAEDLTREAIARCRDATARYISLLSGIVEQSINPPSSRQAVVHPPTINEPAEQPTDQSDPSGSGASSSGGAFSRANSQSSSDRAGRGKPSRKRRKSSTGRDNDNEDDEDLDVDGSCASRQKRTNAGLRLRCVFRARNPIKFNVRDHYSCAMSYFSSFADLRQHIIKKHSREVPLEFACPRCAKSYKTKKELEAHIRVPANQVCELIDLDPEDGVDSITAKRIIDRRRPCSGPTDQDQWKDLWALVFPDDTVLPSHEFQAVVEHFELAKSYIESIQYLQTGLQGFGLSSEVKLALCEHFEMAMNNWNIRAREMDYVNRQSNRNSGVRPSLATLAELQPARDSGVFMETESSRSNSFIRPASGTPLSTYEQLPRSSTGSFRSSQGRPPRRPSSVIYHHQPPQHPLSFDMLSGPHHGGFGTTPEPSRPGLYEPHESALHTQMFEDYEPPLAPHLGHLDPQQMRFMSFERHDAGPVPFDTLHIEHDATALDTSYPIRAGPHRMPNTLPYLSSSEPHMNVTGGHSVN
ncbi:hypothetical protein GQ53DRAFT_740911, partial [Thozetella sp. PMI_491]